MGCLQNYLPTPASVLLCHEEPAADRESHAMEAGPVALQKHRRSLLSLHSARALLTRHYEADQIVYFPALSKPYVILVYFPCCLAKAANFGSGLNVTIGVKFGQRTVVGRVSHRKS